MEGKYDSPNTCTTAHCKYLNAKILFNGCVKNSKETRVAPL